MRMIKTLLKKEERNTIDAAIDDAAVSFQNMNLDAHALGQAYRCATRHGNKEIEPQQAAPRRSERLKSSTTGSNTGAQSLSSATVTACPRAGRTKSNPLPFESISAAPAPIRRVTTTDAADKGDRKLRFAVTGRAVPAASAPIKSIARCQGFSKNHIACRRTVKDGKFCHDHDGFQSPLEHGEWIYYKGLFSAKRIV